ncbi:MAG: energy transducer TonB [Chitinispirillaceae bacterium]|nr:energy transducer TonB [Chitinispirillaceae bacterium]
METTRDRILKGYEIEPEALVSKGEWLFRSVTLLSFAAFGAMGGYLATHNPPPELIEERLAKERQVSFVIEEEKKPELVVQPKPMKEPKPAAPEKKEETPQEPVDLTKKPELNQKIEDPTPDNTQAQTKKPERRVYGLRKVHAIGLGSGGSASEAVIGKLGNTLATDIDTFTVTKEEVKGTVAPVTRVQTYPKLKAPVKPEYTKEMLENRVEGRVKAHILIDVDGKVKKVVVLNDLGYGTKEKVYEACMKLEFEPALANGKPVAVWFAITFRFEMLE